MKQFIAAVLMIITIAVLVVMSGCAAKGVETTGVFDASIYKGYEIRVYEVFGMDCPACASGLVKLVEKNPSVKKSNADWKANKLTIVLEPGKSIDDDTVNSAIKNSSFTPGKRIK